MATLEDKRGRGTWVCDTDDLWHRSVDFDGHKHGLACERHIYAGQQVTGVEMDTTTRPDGECCERCLAFWQGDDA